MAERKIKKWGAIGGAAATALTSILTPLLIMYLDVKPDMEGKTIEAKQKAETGYEAVVPALIEMQDILNDAREWAEDTDKELNDLIKAHRELEKKVVYCEAYMEAIGDRRGVPEPPEPVSSAPEPDIHRDAPPVQQTAKYSIPKNLGDAKAKVEKRKRSGCDPSDPLCGE